MPTREAPPPALAIRFVVRSVLGLAAVLVFGVLLNALLLSATSGQGGTSVTNAAESSARNAGSGGSAQALSILQFVIGVADKIGWLILPVMVVWLLVRRMPQLAVFLAMTAAGSHALNAGGSALIHLVDSTPAVSFFNDAIIGVTVTCAALLLVFLPAIPGNRRGWALAATAILIIGIAALRVIAGTAEPYAVLVGALLGLAWLAVTTLAYLAWRQEEGVQRHPISQGLAPENREHLIPAPAHDAPLPDWRHAGGLVAAVLAIGAILVGVGLLITEVLARVQQLDSSVVHWFASIRNTFLSVLATGFDAVGNTPGIVSVLLFAVPLALAITRRWAPALFLLVAAVGETTLYLLMAVIVSRPRPSVDHLGMDVPPTSSFPSGHVAASLVTYGGIALLVVVWSRARLRYITVVLAVIIVFGVIFARLYWGMHFPTDALASVVFASVWLAVCWWAFRPARGAPCRKEASWD